MNNNVILINQPWFEVIETREFGNPITSDGYKEILAYYYLNLENREDFELFKLNTADTAGDKEIIGVFIMKEGSFGYEEIKQYSIQFGRIKQLVLVIKSSEYNDLVSRRRLQYILTQIFTIPPFTPQLTFEDMTNTFANGKGFVTGSYPENDDPSDYNLVSALKSILIKKELHEAKELVLIVMILVNPNVVNSINTHEGLAKEFQEFNEFFYSKIRYAVYGFYYFLYDSEMETAFSVSIIAAERPVTPN